MVAAYCTGVRCAFVAMFSGFRGCPHNKFKVMPGTIVSVEIKIEKEALSAAEYRPF